MHVKCWGVCVFCPIRYQALLGATEEYIRHIDVACFAQVLDVHHALITVCPRAMYVHVADYAGFICFNVGSLGLLQHSTGKGVP